MVKVIGLETRLAEVLAKRQNQRVDNRDIAQALWRTPARHDEVRIIVYRLKKSCGKNGVDVTIRNIHGRGYILVTKEDQNIEGLSYFTAHEETLLKLLRANPRRVMRYQTILKNIWGDGSRATRALLMTFVSQLRKKLTARGDRSMILNHPGIGYEWIPAK